jgi:two-component system nitrogen regulation response regulator NtrX
MAGSTPSNVESTPSKVHIPSYDDRPEQELYSQSPAMREVVAQVERAARSRAGVTIRGEDGSGRRVVARAVHALSAGTGGLFRAVDCAALDGDQLDAALFGAFGARGNGEAGHGFEHVGRGGLLYQCNGGTLYLQNVAEAAARSQARLARILRDREAVLEETGETTAIDVRPITVFGPDQGEANGDGRVREELLRRLSVFCIDVPPLRKRREDIPALATCFVREVSAALGVPPAALSRSALSLMCALPWRHNADELRSLVEVVVAGLGDSPSIGIEQVLAHLKLDGDAVAFAYGGTLRQARIQFEREYIASVLDQHRGRISEAAKVLGIQRTNLYRKIRELRVGRAGRDTAPIGPPADT